MVSFTSTTSLNRRITRSSSSPLSGISSLLRIFLLITVLTSLVHAQSRGGVDGDNRDGDGGGEEGEEQQTVIVVAVGRLGDDLALKFSPEEVVAKPGDLVQFQFYPANHSVAQADFESPCVPMDNTTRRAGFWSQFQPLDPDPDFLSTFTIPIVDEEPIYFYCSQGRHCQQGMVGAINPTREKSLAAFKAAAATAVENLSPGEAPRFTEGNPTSPAPDTDSPDTREPVNPGGTSGETTSDGQQGRDGTSTNQVSNANSSNPVMNVGLIVGAIIGGVVLLVIIVGGVLFWTMRARREKELGQRMGQSPDDGRAGSAMGGSIVGGGWLGKKSRRKSLDKMEIGKPTPVPNNGNTLLRGSMANLPSTLGPRSGTPSGQRPGAATPVGVARGSGGTMNEKVGTAMGGSGINLVVGGRPPPPRPPASSQSDYSYPSPVSRASPAPNQAPYPTSYSNNNNNNNNNNSRLNAPYDRPLHDSFTRGSYDDDVLDDYDSLRDSRLTDYQIPIADDSRRASIPISIYSPPLPPPNSRGPPPPPLPKQQQQPPRELTYSYIAYSNSAQSSAQNSPRITNQTVNAPPKRGNRQNSPTSVYSNYADLLSPGGELERDGERPPVPSMPMYAYGAGPGGNVNSGVQGRLPIREVAGQRGQGQRQGYGGGGYGRR